MQLTYHTDFALRVLLYLLDLPGQKVSTREMAAFYGISLHHLTKVAKALTRGGWLVATRGGGGGLQLAAHTPATQLGEIVRFTENFQLLECFDPARNTCPIIQACRLKPALYRARQAFFAVLDATTVAELTGSTAALQNPGSTSLHSQDPAENLDRSP